ncbi:hypothetical protein GGP50_003289 [Salinibacter ruber]|uniref:hypothetical protein n=1 Tax=Salinibacter ruber TaxID=146919 RepID=UPI00216A72C2|nr:hypothetical protein [Salinibacter ruber]MCS3613517.1 hypothetical protein [Salinibacter ruber]MCS4195052.1 hypothetical protein [Salinibacter ruber]
MSDPLKNPDRDEDHQRRRDLGDEEDERDGLDVAEKLYGGLPTDSDKIDPDTDAE